MPTSKSHSDYQPPSKRAAGKSRDDTPTTTADNPEEIFTDSQKTMLKSYIDAQVKAQTEEIPRTTKKTEKIPAPDFFSGDQDKTELWLLQLTVKLEGNEDAFPTTNA